MSLNMTKLEDSLGRLVGLVKLHFTRVSIKPLLTFHKALALLIQIQAVINSLLLTTP